MKPAIMRIQTVTDSATPQANTLNTNNWDDGEYRQEEEEEQNPEGNDG